MYIIDNHKDLIGKEIVYFNPCESSDDLVIATKCGGIFLAEINYYDDGDADLNPASERFVLQELKANKRLRDDLVKAEVIEDKTAEEWEEERKRAEEEMKERHRAQQEVYEKRRLNQLLDKYGIPNEYGQ